MIRYVDLHNIFKDNFFLSYTHNIAINIYVAIAILIIYKGLPVDKIISVFSIFFIFFFLYIYN